MSFQTLEGRFDQWHHLTTGMWQWCDCYVSVSCHDKTYNIPNIISISSNIQDKKCLNGFAGLTDGQDRQTDRLDSKPKVSFDFIGRGLKTDIW